MARGGSGAAEYAHAEGAARRSVPESTPRCPRSRGRALIVTLSSYDGCVTAISRAVSWSWACKALPLAPSGVGRCVRWSEVLERASPVRLAEEGDHHDSGVSCLGLS